MCLSIRIIEYCCLQYNKQTRKNLIKQYILTTVNYFMVHQEPTMKKPSFHINLVFPSHHHE